MDKLESESWIQMVVVCDKCSELLNHSVGLGSASIETRVEPCPECSQPGLKLSDDQLDLVLRVIKHVKPKARASMVFNLADYDDMVEIEDKISTLNSAVRVAGS